MDMLDELGVELNMDESYEQNFLAKSNSGSLPPRTSSAAVSSSPLRGPSPVPQDEEEVWEVHSSGPVSQPLTSSSPRPISPKKAGSPEASTDGSPRSAVGGTPKLKRIGASASSSPALSRNGSAPGTPTSARGKTSGSGGGLNSSSKLAQSSASVGPSTPRTARAAVATELSASGLPLLEAVYASMREAKGRLVELSKQLRVYAKCMTAMSEAGVSLGDSFLVFTFPSNPDLYDAVRASANNLRVHERTRTHIAAEFLPQMADAVKMMAETYGKETAQLESAHRKPLAEAAKKMESLEKKAAKMAAKKGDTKLQQAQDLARAASDARALYQTTLNEALLAANAAERAHSLAIFKLLDSFSERLHDAMDRFLTCAIENEKSYHHTIASSSQHSLAVLEDVKSRSG